MNAFLCLETIDFIIFNVMVSFRTHFHQIWMFSSSDDDDLRAARKMQNAAFCSSAPGSLLGLSNPKNSNGSSLRRSYHMCMRKPRSEMSRRDALSAFTAAAASAVAVGLNYLPSQAAMYSSDTNSAEFAPKGDLSKIEAYLPQIRGGYDALLDLDKNWDSKTANYDGDTVRRILGTVGVYSPLFNIRKTFLKSWQIAADSPKIDDETLEEMDSDWNLVLDGIASVDSQMYSVSFTELESTKDSLIFNAKVALGDTIGCYDRFLKNLLKAL